MPSANLDLGWRFAAQGRESMSIELLRADRIGAFPTEASPRISASPPIIVMLAFNIAQGRLACGRIFSAGTIPWPSSTE